MKSIQKFKFIVSGITSVFVSTVVITGNYLPKAQAAAINLVENGDFSADPLVSPDDPTLNNPYITGWFNGGNFDGTATTYIDNYTIGDTASLSRSVRIGARRENTPNGSVPIFTYISQNLNTVVGQKYELSYNLANIDEDHANEFRTYVGGQLIDDRVDVPWQQFNIDPTLSTFYFVATSNVTELKLAGKQTYAWFNVDNVSVKPVPEPLTLGGTAIAGLLGIWLRKKTRQY